jgi:exopolyphosphatase/pppGpp-phosphohydrolase
MHSHETTDAALASDAGRRYRAVRSGLPGGAPVTLLHIGAEKTVVATGTGVEPATIVFLDIGARSTATAFFRNEPPTPGEMENAIMAVEDAVIGSRAKIAADSTLVSTDPAIREIALIAGAADQPEVVLGIDATERAFERLAAITLGRPASQDIIPGAATFAATLLILREFMHHLKFASITVRA